MEGVQCKLSRFLPAVPGSNLGHQENLCIQKIFQRYFSGSLKEVHLSNNDDAKEKKITVHLWFNNKNEKETQKKFFKGCPGRGANLGYFDFHLFSLSIAGP